MRNELKKLTTKELIELVKTFELYPAVTLKDGKDYILSYLEDESCTISKKDIAEYLLKNGVVITDDNIHLYYLYMNENQLKENKVKLTFIFNSRFLVLKQSLFLNHSFKNWLHFEKTNFNGYILNQSFFGIKDTLTPLSEYISEIKSSNTYKEYYLNNLVKKYDLSISQLMQLEHELFADDSTYISNIDNLIYSALDKIADDFKMNIIAYIEENDLQEETGIGCISNIKVVIKDGEYQGIFKEFESYGLNDFSVQNITMFIDRYKEIKESVEYKPCNTKVS